MREAGAADDSAGVKLILAPSPPTLTRTLRVTNKSPVDLRMEELRGGLADAGGD